MSRVQWQIILHFDIITDLKSKLSKTIITDEGSAEFDPDIERLAEMAAQFPEAENKQQRVTPTLLLGVMAAILAAIVNMK